MKMLGNYKAYILIALSVATANVNAQSRCSNPNGNRGACISIHDCDILLNLANKSPLLEKDRNFLTQSRCFNGVGQFPHVCCGEDDGFLEEEETPEIHPSNGLGQQLPQPNRCGVEPLGEKIWGGKATSIDEFTWMTLLQYTYPDGRKSFGCSGSLINQRYVLTAAHCVTDFDRNQRLTKIRLGEFNTQTRIDCQKEGDCNDPVLDIGFEEVTPHKGYNSKTRFHDIALIRLDRDVDYTHFIKPVCLPDSVKLRRSNAGNNLTVAGWGKTENNTNSPVKLKLDIPVVGYQDCAARFNARGFRIIDNQICAGGRTREDSCSGDSGGPLMVKSGSSWVLEGIVSYGYTLCGETGWPGVYTRVSSYENWIRQNLKP